MFRAVAVRDKPTLQYVMMHAMPIRSNKRYHKYASIVERDNEGHQQRLLEVRDAEVSVTWSQ